ncbi:MAG: glycine cleavage T C-terminal barrel domain-containing protein [Gemmatimonadaceae bacterium]
MTTRLLPDGEIGAMSDTESAPKTPNENEAARKPPLRFVAPASDYAAIRLHAAVADRSVRSRGTFAGPKSADVLTGLVTNDILALTPGYGAYAAALTPKGKIIADVRVFARQSDFFVDVPPRAAAGFWSMVRKFVNPRLSRFDDISSHVSELAVLGPKSVDTLRRALGEESAAVESLSIFGSLELETPHGALTIARVPDFGVESFALWMPSDARETLLAALVREGAHEVGASTLEVARIEAGRPEWGIEMDDSTIPQEANFDELQAISYTKGCYTGQETVARVHFRGHVNRYLRGLRLSSDDTLPTRATLHDAEGKSVGDVRSVATSPRLGGIGLGMVRREVELESELMARWDGGEQAVRVTTLPFPGA